MSKIRRKFDDEFRKNAVKLSYATSGTVKDLAADLGIHPSLIYRWRRIYTEQGGDKTKVAEQQDALRKLQLENAELKMEIEMLKKSRGLLCQTSEVKYRFVLENRDYPVTKWADILGFSTSAFYDWLKTKSERDKQQTKYEKAIIDIFNKSRKTYGPDRVCGMLRRQGYTASYKRVSRIMKKLGGLSSIHNRRRQRSLTDSSKSKGKNYPNLVRELDLGGSVKPFEVVTSDISYIKTQEGFEYLCKVRDLATGIVLAHTMGDNMDAELVTSSIRKARRRWNLPEGCIHHSDLGSQYTAGVTVKLLQELSFQQSFSRRGKPGDNAWSESFFSILKKGGGALATFSDTC